MQLAGHWRKMNSGRAPGSSDGLQSRVFHQDSLEMKETMPFCLAIGASFHHAPAPGISAGQFKSHSYDMK
jgi:hypothetical protein